MSGSDELFPIDQRYYDILNKLIGTNGGTITVFDNNGKEHNIGFTKQELQNQQGTIRLFESRFLALYGEKRGLDAVQITQGLANASAVVSAGGVLAWGLGEYGLAEPMANGGKWLARRMFNRQTLIKGAKAGSLSAGFNFSLQTAVNMLVNHGDLQSSLNDVDYGDVAVSFGTGYLTAPLATGNKIYDVLSSGGLNVADQYAKSKVGSDKYVYTGSHAVVDFTFGFVAKYLGIRKQIKAQSSPEAKILMKQWKRLAHRYKRLSRQTAARRNEVLRAENSWKEYGKRFSDTWHIKLMKAIFAEVFRPEEKPAPDTGGASYE